MFGFKWTYRVKDCKERTIALCQTLEQVEKLTGASPFLLGLLSQRISICDGVRYKVDVRGSFCDGTWNLK
jgi:hypothetical protein